MPSADLYIRAQNGAVALAIRNLKAFWGRVERLDALGKRSALETFWPSLVGKYGEMTAMLAMNRFEELTGLTPELGETAPVEKLNARMRWGLEPLFGGAGEVAAMARLVVLADELVKQPGRDAMVASARAHGAQVARVPSGAETCSWCLMLASRGAVYHTEASALSASHGFCDCRLEPVVDDSDMARLEAEGYDPDALYGIYSAARESAGSGDPKKILAAMRDREGIH